MEINGLENCDRLYYCTRDKTETRDKTAKQGTTKFSISFFSQFCI